MAELLVKGISVTHPNTEKNIRGCYKIGMIVNIMPDGHLYGFAETPPMFYKIKIPLIPIDNQILVRLSDSQKIIIPIDGGVTQTHQILRRRKCWLKYADLPAAAKNKLFQNGEIIIKASPQYSGAYDYTWSQVKNYFWNDDSQSNFTEEL